MKIFRKITFENLKRNKTRTIVTIIGIILSAAMFTAVTTAVSSLRNLLLERAVLDNGYWHVCGFGLDGNDIEIMENTEESDEFTAFENIGFALLDHSYNAYKPYLFLAGIDEHAKDLTSIHVTEGELPKSADEILLPEHLSANGGVYYEIGDVISLSVGDRQYANEESISNHIQYSEDNHETIKVIFEKEYTVVGFYERPNFEDFSAPGYTALTVSDPSVKNTENTTYDVYVSLKHPKDAENFGKKYLWNKEGGDINNDYLRWIGASPDMSFNMVMYSMSAILIGIIFAGSVALIYNAFAISISERMKQFGILSSLGATRKQLMGTVITEGCFLAAAGIPLGILSGLLGLGVTFHFVGGMFGNILSGENLSLTLTPSIPGILIAAAIAFITILLSAYIPAKRVFKSSAMETIRQSNEIKLTAKQIRTGKLSAKLFGFSGLIAVKNYKRNRRKYRATVASIFISVVLFISAVSFTEYLKKGSNAVFDDTENNMTATVYRYIERGTEAEEFAEEETAESAETSGNDRNASENLQYTDQEIFEGIAKMSGVSELSEYMLMPVYLCLNSSAITDEYLKELESDAQTKLTSVIYVSAELIFISDSEYERLAASENIAVDTDSNKPAALVSNTISNYVDDKYVTYEAFKNIDTADAKIVAALPEVGGMTFGYISWVRNGFGATYIDDNGYYHVLNISDVSEETSLDVSGVTESRAPLSGGSSSLINIYYPLSSKDVVLSENANLFKQFTEEDVVEHYSIISTDHNKTSEELSSYFNDMNLKMQGSVSGYVYDIAATREEDQTLIFLLNVFSWGFIILISLISMTNIFNTITTNIRLRRKEIAMLISAGMDPKGMRKMLAYEGGLYGSRGLLFGLPVAFALTYLIWKSVSDGVDMKFFIPWYSVVIAVGSVFLIIFITMIYAVKKTTADSAIEALKEDNI